MIKVDAETLSVLKSIKNYMIYCDKVFQSYICKAQTLHSDICIAHITFLF